MTNTEYELLGRYAVQLNQIAEQSYQDARAASKALKDMDAPEQLLWLRDAVLSHVVWARGCQFRKPRKPRKLRPKP